MRNTPHSTLALCDLEGTCRARAGLSRTAQVVSHSRLAFACVAHVAPLPLRRSHLHTVVNVAMGLSFAVYAGMGAVCYALLEPTSPATTD